MPDDPELGHLLEGSRTAASDATLTAIGVRAARQRATRLRAMTACALVIGLVGIGFGTVVTATRPSPTATPSPARAFALPSPSATRWTSEPQPLGTAPKGLRWSDRTASSAAAEASPARAPSASVGTDFCTVNGCPGVVLPAEGPLTRLFDRTAGDVTVRAFTDRIGLVQPLPMIPAGSASSNPASSPTPATCSVMNELALEISNPSAIGAVSVPSISSASLNGPFAVIDSAVVGVAESSPIAVVAVQVGPGVATVQASFADGANDEMAVDAGWAVLVDDGSGPLPATITALGSSGSPLGTASVTSDAAVAEPSSCTGPIAVPASGAASGSRSAG